MLLTELIDAVVTNTGQFILSDDPDDVFDCNNISKPRFWNLARRALLIYQKHVPVSRKLSVQVDQLVYEFGVGSPLIDPPVWISSVIPVGNTGGIFSPHIIFDRNSELVPRTSTWEYRSPKLYTMEDGYMDVTGHYNYTITPTVDGNGKLTEVDIVELTEADNLYIDLVTAHFMIALGRSRRQFSAQELPIQIDTESMVEDGKELLEATQEALLVKSRWWESIGA